MRTKHRRQHKVRLKPDFQPFRLRGVSPGPRKRVPHKQLISEYTLHRRQPDLEPRVNVPTPLSIGSETRDNPVWPELGPQCESVDQAIDGLSECVNRAVNSIQVRQTSDLKNTAVQTHQASQTSQPPSKKRVKPVANSIADTVRGLDSDLFFITQDRHIQAQCAESKSNEQEKSDPVSLRMHTRNESSGLVRLALDEAIKLYSKEQGRKKPKKARRKQRCWVAAGKPNSTHNAVLKGEMERRKQILDSSNLTAMLRTHSARRAEKLLHRMATIVDDRDHSEPVLAYASDSDSELCSAKVNWNPRHHGGVEYSDKHTLWVQMIREFECGKFSLSRPLRITQHKLAKLKDEKATLNSSNLKYGRSMQFKQRLMEEMLIKLTLRQSIEKWRCGVQIRKLRAHCLRDRKQREEEITVRHTLFHWLNLALRIQKQKDDLIYLYNRAVKLRISRLYFDKWVSHAQSVIHHESLVNQFTTQTRLSRKQVIFQSWKSAAFALQFQQACEYFADRVREWRWLKQWYECVRKRKSTLVSLAKKNGMDPDIYLQSSAIMRRVKISRETPFRNTDRIRQWGSDLRLLKNHWIHQGCYVEDTTEVREEGEPKKGNSMSMITSMADQMHERSLLEHALKHWFNHMKCVSTWPELPMRLQIREVGKQRGQREWVELDRHLQRQASQSIEQWRIYLQRRVFQQGWKKEVKSKLRVREVAVGVLGPRNSLKKCVRVWMGQVQMAKQTRRNTRKRLFLVWLDRARKSEERNRVWLECERRGDYSLQRRVFAQWKSLNSQRVDSMLASIHRNVRLQKTLFGEWRDRALFDLSEPDWEISPASLQISNWTLHSDSSALASTALKRWTLESNHELSRERSQDNLLFSPHKSF